MGGHSEFDVKILRLSLKAEEERETERWYDNVIILYEPNMCP